MFSWWQISAETEAKAHEPEQEENTFVTSLLDLEDRMIDNSHSDDSDEEPLPPPPPPPPVIVPAPSSSPTHHHISSPSSPVAPVNVSSPAKQAPHSKRTLGPVPPPPPRPLLAPQPDTKSSKANADSSRPIKRARKEPAVAPGDSDSSSGSQLSVQIVTRTSSKRNNKNKDKALEYSASSRKLPTNSLRKVATEFVPAPASKIAPPHPVPSRKKPRLSLEQEVEKNLKLQAAPLMKEFPTISSYVHHLNQFESARDPNSSFYTEGTANPGPGVFHGCRIIVVNGNNKSSPNAMDMGVRTNLAVLAKNGATLVPPDEFVGAPSSRSTSSKGKAKAKVHERIGITRRRTRGRRKESESEDDDVVVEGGEELDNVYDPAESDETVRQKAARGGWTTHIIPFEIDFAAKPKFSSLHSLLGNGIKADQLGEFVQVVSFKWASDSVKARARVAEWVYRLPDDPRNKRLSISSNAGGSKVLPAFASPKKAGGARKVPTPDSEDENASNPVKGIPRDQADREVSPFGPHDYPRGEEPPPNYFGSPNSSPEQSSRLLGQILVESPPPQTTVLELGSDDEEDERPSNETTDPIVDPPLTASIPTPGNHAKKTQQIAFSGLENQLRILDGWGDDVDKLLEGMDKDSDMIYSKKSDDFETDEEKGDQHASKKLEKRKKPFGGRYACDVSSTGGEKTDSPNEDIAVVLEQLAKMAQNDQWRERGYRRAAGAFRNCITRIQTYEQAKQLDGVGDRIAQKVVEIIKTGTHRRVKQRSEKDKVLDIFKGIYGVGPKIAEDFYEQGCRSLEDVKKLRLTDAQKLGLQYYHDLAVRIPREEVQMIHEAAKAAAREVDPALEVYCMGSFRRGAADCGDIDLLLTRNPSRDGRDHSGMWISRSSSSGISNSFRFLGMIRNVVKVLNDQSYIRHLLTSPEDWNALDVKFNGLCGIPGGKVRRLDILGVPWDEMPAALIYFTGNDYFNRSMRLKARHLGYRLNQRGLFKDVSRGQNGLKLTEGTKVPCKSEQDIFKKLGVTWRPPNERIP
ncbi:hypothetical protein T439DRAFT_345536 [Meredithblackwellia eburnea MCA 4105]